MADDNDLIEEYIDYSNVPSRYSRLDEESKILYRELNKIRFKFNKGYISEERFYKQIDNYDLYEFLTEYEMKELESRQKSYKKEDGKLMSPENKRDASGDFFGCLYIFVILSLVIGLIGSLVYIATFIIEH